MPLKHNAALRERLWLAFSLAVFALIVVVPPFVNLGAYARGYVRAGLIRDSLSLATFDTVWTRVRDSHYDSLMGGVNWNALRDSLRPIAARTQDRVALRDLLRGMLSKLGTSHYAIIPRERALVFRDSGTGSTIPGDIGLEFRPPSDSGDVFVSRVEPGSPAALAGIRAGFKVVQVNDVRPSEEPHGPRLLNIRRAMRAQTETHGVPGTSVSLHLKDQNGIQRHYTVTRRESPGEPVRFANLPPLAARVTWQKKFVSNGCVGIIAFNTWTPVIAPRIDAAVDSVRSCAGVVIDLRGNGGGVLNMIVGVSGHFLSRADTLAVIQARRSRATIVANPRMSNSAGQRVQPYARPLAILVDAFTGSTSEVFAGALQSLGRARIFGENTSGQALPASTHDLPNHDILLYVVADLRGPKGERWEGVGIQPDQAVPLYASDLLANSEDKVLAAALSWIGSRQTKEQ